MDARVQDFLNNAKAREGEKQGRDKDALLIALGLYDREYSEKNEYSEEYPEFENGRYYRKKAIPVTDEEYAQIRQTCETAEPKKRNPMSLALMIIAGIVYAVSFIYGIIAANVFGGFVFSFGLPFWGIGLIAGSVLLGIGCIIEQLDCMKRG